MGTIILRFVFDEREQGILRAAEIERPESRDALISPLPTPYAGSIEVCMALGLLGLMSFLSCGSLWECRSQIASWKLPA